MTPNISNNRADMAATKHCTGQSVETGVEGRFSPRPPIFRSLVTQISVVFLLACHNLRYVDLFEFPRCPQPLYSCNTCKAHRHKKGL